MANRPTRQELYERIQKSSKDEVILEEMVRLGFWPRNSGLPDDPAEQLRRKAELEREYQAITTETNRLGNIARLKQDLRKKRLADSRAKQQQNKLRREQDRLARAQAWKQKKAQELTFLGRGVSGGLSNKEGKPERLAKWGLPALPTPESVAGALGLPIGKLRQLAYTRLASTSTNYVRFQLPKKTGGMRLISAPMPRLKKAQRWILDNILVKVGLHEAAHGFRAERSIVTNALPHVGADAVVNLDLQDFFPSVLYPRVKGAFRALGYSEATAIVLALLCTEPDVQKVELDGVAYYVASGPRRLPQGAPTSPALTNLLCRRLDRRLQGAARKLGLTYTRYADDLTFSCKGRSHDVNKLLWQVGKIVEGEGFRVHPDKTRVLRKARQQEVTGVVVNTKPGVDRKELRRFRALLHQIGKTGLEGKSWHGSKDVLSSARGFANFVAMVDKTKGQAFLKTVGALEAKYGHARPAAPAKQAAPTPAPQAAPQPPPTEPKPPEPTPPAPPKKKWWRGS